MHQIQCVHVGTQGPSPEVLGLSSDMGQRAEARGFPVRSVPRQWQQGPQRTPGALGLRASQEISQTAEEAGGRASDSCLPGVGSRTAALAGHTCGDRWGLQDNPSPDNGDLCLTPPCALSVRGTVGEGEAAAAQAWGPGLPPLSALPAGRPHGWPCCSDSLALGAANFGAWPQEAPALPAWVCLLAKWGAMAPTASTC